MLEDIVMGALAHLSYGSGTELCSDDILQLWDAYVFVVSEDRRR